MGREKAVAVPTHFLDTTKRSRCAGGQDVALAQRHPSLTAFPVARGGRTARIVSPRIAGSGPFLPVGDIYRDGSCAGAVAGIVVIPQTGLSGVRKCMEGRRCEVRGKGQLPA